jgi:hypothetical protein
MFKFKNNNLINSLELNNKNCRNMLFLKSKYNLSGIEFKALLSILVEIPHKPDNLNDCEDIYLEILIRKFLSKDTIKWTIDLLHEQSINKFKLPNNDKLFGFILESYSDFITVFEKNELTFNMGDFYCFMFKILSGYPTNDSPCSYPLLYTFLNNSV